VARQWSTAVRYRADVARQKGFFAEAAPLPTWTEKQLADIETERMAWIRSRAGAEGPTLEALEVGQKLPTRPMGPHSLPSLASEWRAYTFTVWARAPTKDPITSRRPAGSPRWTAIRRAKDDPDWATVSTTAPRAAHRRGARQADRDAPRLRLRSLDGRLGPRLCRRLGR